MVRTALFEAANVMLISAVRFSELKAGRRASPADEG
jgi:hypothetical protein